MERLKAASEPVFAGRTHIPYRTLSSERLSGRRLAADVILCALVLLLIAPDVLLAAAVPRGKANPAATGAPVPMDTFEEIKITGDGPEAKVSSRLRHLVREIAARGPTREAVLASHPSALSNQLRKVADTGMVQCYVEYAAAPEAVANAITAVGGKVELVSTPMRVVQAQIPYDKLDALATSEAVTSVRLPGYPVLRTGSVTSQGDTVHRCNTVRTTHGLTGAGIKVGLISDGINGITISQASDDIPATYEAQSARADGNLNAGPEGTAMMEIVYDLAPGAGLAFSNPGTSAEMVSAINILDSTFHCKVIADDIGFADEPYFEDGPIVARINQATANGAIYCSAAGNAADQNYYEGDFVAMTKRIGNRNLTVQNFDGAGDWNMEAYVPGGGKWIVVVLQWNDPWGASGNDYDLYLTNASGTVLTSSKNTQNGNDKPLEAVQYVNNNAEPTHVYIVVSKAGGATRHLKIVSWGHGDYTEYSTATGSVWGHPSGENVICCGAVYQGTPSVIEPFSSRGPVRIDFPSLVYRNKPDLCGVDGVSVTGNGGFYNPFYGTSAAAPHVAAICAQIWSADPAMSNTAVRTLIQSTAVDLGAAGYDTTYGYGRADAWNAASSLDQCPSDPNKTQPGVCGCGVPDTDSDSDGVADCIDGCPSDSAKTQPGVCGCGVPDTDSDSDGVADCIDACPSDSAKTQPGVCGCGVPDIDADSDGVPDCHDLCPATVTGAPVDADGCPPAIPGDFEPRDGDVDVADLAVMASCQSGSMVPHNATPACDAADLDGDDDVDQDDFGKFQRCYVGSGVLGNPTCAE